MDKQAGWTIESVRRLAEMAREGVPPETISLAQKRPIETVRAKLSELGITVIRSEGHKAA